MFRIFIHRAAYRLSVSALAALSFAFVTPAAAQMANNPWSFQPQNRASVAALMRQVEKENGAAAVTQISSPPAVTNLVCGSDGKSSASGNTTCVILNNAAGDIDVGQDAKGDQTASSATTTETNTPAGSDDVLATLNSKPGS